MTGNGSSPIMPDNGTIAFYALLSIVSTSMGLVSSVVVKIRIIIELISINRKK